MFILYNLILTLLSPIWVPWMLFRATRRKEGPNWSERFGKYPLDPRKDRKRIWFHTVSVGEVIAATPILRELRKKLPDHEIVLTVTTSSGHRTAQEYAVDLYDHLLYFPIDVARFQLQAMQRVQPSVVAVMETELWYNFLWAAKTFEARTVLVNGRISERSFKRSKPFRWFFKGLLKEMDRCLMQTEADAERIRFLGANSVDVLGNSKFDQALEGLDADPVEIKRTLHLSDKKPVVVIGSTRGAEEEEFVRKAILQVGLDNIQVVHAPRHLERIEPLLEATQHTFGTSGLRSKLEKTPYLLLDTYGELSEIYAAADLVIVGGGFTNNGGQNLLQPLAHGKPVLHGPFMQNFRAVSEAALASGASKKCRTPEELAAAMRELIDQPVLRQKMGEAAKKMISESVGASRRYAEAIAEEAKLA